MTIFTGRSSAPQPVSVAQRRRDQASVALDAVWPRGATVDRDSARERIWTMSRGGIHRNDLALMDARLIDLADGGLIELQRRVDGDQVHESYFRPWENIVIEDPTNRPPPPVMWHPANGDEPRPWAEVSAEIDAKMQDARRKREADMQAQIEAGQRALRATSEPADADATATTDTKDAQHHD